MIKINKYNDFGKGNYDWLKTSYHFSFANYYNPNRRNFGSIRVLNDDYIAGYNGFDPHPHQNMEIITYIVDGELTHQDSMGNKRVLTKGDVQYMSAGTGITHSEYNNSSQELHLYQIWILPEKKDLKPNHGDMKFNTSERDNKLLHIVSNHTKNGRIHINQDADIYVGEFSKGKDLIIKTDGHDYIYLVLISGMITVNDLLLGKQDSVETSTDLDIKVLEKSHLLILKINELS